MTSLSYDDCRNALLDELSALDGAAADCDDRLYYQGCGADDRYDARGERLRPRVNEGGEPWWM